MKKFFDRYKIKFKIMVLFDTMVFTLLLFVVGGYFVLKSLNKAHQESILWVVVNENIKDTRYLLQSNRQAFVGLAQAQSATEAENWLRQHQTNAPKIRASFDTIPSLAENLPDTAFNHLKLRIKQAMAENDSMFSVIVEPYVKTIYALKVEYFANSELLSSQAFQQQQDTSQTEWFESPASVQENSEIQTQLDDLENHVNLATQEIIASLEKHEMLCNKALQTSSENYEGFLTRNIRLLIAIAIAGTLLSILLGLYVGNLLASPINQINRIIKKLSRGELPEKLRIKSRDEIGQMAKSINALIEGLTQTSEFSYEIGKGNYNSQFSPLSENDVLGNSLLDMRDSLKRAKEEQEKRQTEDFQRNWTSQGLAQFAEILRKDNDDINRLAYNVLVSLVRYLDAIQGGVFLLNDHDKSHEPFIEQVAAFAYNRRKQANKHFALKEGLVGRCIDEQESIYMTEIPESYVRITSGLGDSTPRYLLIVPLKINKEVLGAIEIASFNEFRPYQIEFAEKLGESIATTISSVKINARTADLLEQSQEQAEEMAAQEEEMRQNLEEMQATQEEAMRREEQLRQHAEALEEAKKELDRKDTDQRHEIERLTLANEKRLEELRLREEQSRKILETSLDGVIVIDQQGIVEFFNQAAQELWGYEASEVVGKNITLLMPRKHARKHDEYIENYLKTGIKKIIGKGREVPIIQRNGAYREVYLSVIENVVGGEIKFTGFVRDLTQEKRTVAECNELMESLVAKELQFRKFLEEADQMLKENNIQPPQRKMALDEKLIDWGEKYKTGIELIDRQHRKLVDIINRLYNAFKRGKASENLQIFLGELIEYTHTHFSTEEQYFKEFNYQFKERHIFRHKQFTDKVIEFQKDFREGRAAVSHELLTFLKNWVLNHILSEDMEYVELFKEHGLE